MKLVYQLGENLKPKHRSRVPTDFPRGKEFLKLIKAGVFPQKGMKNGFDECIPDFKTNPRTTEPVSNAQF